MRSARDARELRLDDEVDMSLLVPLVPEVVELGAVLEPDMLESLVPDDVALGDVVVPLVPLEVVELGAVLVPLEVVELGAVVVPLELGGVVVPPAVVPPLRLEPVFPVLPVVPEPVAPPVVPDAVPELLVEVSDEPPDVEPLVPVPVALEPDVPVPVPLLCAYDTPITATIDAMAAARVKRFGNLLMWILL